MALPNFRIQQPTCHTKGMTLIYYVFTVPLLQSPCALFSPKLSHIHGTMSKRTRLVANSRFRAGVILISRDKLDELHEYARNIVNYFTTEKPRWGSIIAGPWEGDQSRHKRPRPLLELLQRCMADRDEDVPDLNERVQICEQKV